MSANHYDNPVFFEKYGDMARSRQGLAGAGEWHEMRRLLPDLTGKRLLDLGCGYGWHCRYAAQQGAAFVLGVDVSERMLEKARELTGPSPVITYVQGSIEQVALPAQPFDVVLSSLALHYVADFAAVCRRVYDCLRPGGDFVFSVEHPIFTAQGRQEWVLDDQGQPLYWPVDRYFEEGEREAVFLGEPITKQHHTLTTFVQGLVKQGFVLQGLVEPTPSEEMLAQHPQMQEEKRRPMMLLIAARKKQG